MPSASNSTSSPGDETNSSMTAATTSRSSSVDDSSRPVVASLPPTTASISTPTGTSTASSSSSTGSTAGPSGQQQPCCDNGRPIITDPISGQTICSCQYDSYILNCQRLAASSGLPFPIHPATVSSAAAAYGAAAAGGAPGIDASQASPPFLPPLASFYPPMANSFDLKENLEALRSMGPYAAPSMYYPYDGGIGGYPFGGGYAMDGTRRKNATRETTSTLKAWLSDHRKNPYPTKGEKIMLAIITKMTLTQVSTWFANARRRLKKENKMTWSPRNRCDDDGDDADGDKTDANESRDGREDGSSPPLKTDTDAESDIVDIEDDSNNCDPHDRDHNTDEPAPKRQRRESPFDLKHFSADPHHSSHHHPHHLPSSLPQSAQRRLLPTSSLTTSNNNAGVNNNSNNSSNPSSTPYPHLPAHFSLSHFPHLPFNRPHHPSLSSGVPHLPHHISKHDSSSTKSSATKPRIWSIADMTT